MKKKFVTYIQYNKVKKAVIDEATFNRLKLDPTVEELIEYDNEMLMERRFGEKIGVSDNRKTLLG